MSRSYTLLQNSKPIEIDFHTDLNPQQIAAVQAPPGAHLVIAGAGSGKTRTLTYRVAWLLSQGIPASQILLLTFTNKAAREMLERVASLTPQGIAGIWGGTFHSVGNRILRAHGHHLGFQLGFSILDRGDEEEMIESIVKREGLRTPDKRFPKSEVLSEIFSFSTNTLNPILTVVESRYPYFLNMVEQIERVAKIYTLHKQETNSLDFDDLLSQSLHLLENFDEVSEFYQQKFLHILVDEYQDTNRLQSEFVERLAARHNNMMIVGDDAQSIYSWRGADIGNILDFPRRHKNASIFRIETNYRSTPEILSLANVVISANQEQFQKTLTAIRPSGNSKPAWVPLGTNTEQASFVAQRILELHEENGIPLNEMAVLYRAHFHSMEVQLEFTRRGIPFVITSGLRFFEQAHIKDVAAFMKFTVNPRDEISFKRMVKLLPGIGAKSADVLWLQVSKGLGEKSSVDRIASLDIKVPAKAKQSWTQLTHALQELAPSQDPQPPASMIETILHALYDDYMKQNFANYEARREDIGTLSGYARGFQNTEEFLSQLALLGTLETNDTLATSSEDEKVTLSSIHQAKGLEWKVVFLIWLADGMFPGSRSLDNPMALEEERRLFYVAITRCKDELYLTYPQLRLGGYGEAFQEPSRFLEGIPKKILEHWQIRHSVSTEEPF